MARTAVFNPRAPTRIPGLFLTCRLLKMYCQPPSNHFCVAPGWQLRTAAAQPCLTLGNPVDCSPPGSSVHGDSPGKNVKRGLPCPPPGDLPNPGSNPGLLHYKWILYHLSHQGSPRILEWVALSLLQGYFPTQESNRGLLLCRQILYQLSCLEAQGGCRGAEIQFCSYTRGCQIPGD